MNVELAQERILLLPDVVGAEQALARAWARRLEAFGALARIGGLLSRPRDEEFEVAYREQRLQPFWRLSAATEHVYERDRPHRLKVAGEVEAVRIGDKSFSATAKEATVVVTECCRESARREWLFDGLTKKADPSLKDYLDRAPLEITPEDLDSYARSGVIVLPPQAKASMLTRDVISQAIRKIEADRVLEERMQIDAIDLYYRPVHAVRYRWQTKEAVVEVCAVTGETRLGGSTFEAYLGKLVDRQFLLDAGLEAANMLIPGVNLAKMFVTRLGGKG